MSLLRRNRRQKRVEDIVVEKNTTRILVGLEKSSLRMPLSLNILILGGVFSLALIVIFITYFRVPTNTNSDGSNGRIMSRTVFVVTVIVLSIAFLGVVIWALVLIKKSSSS